MNQERNVQIQRQELARLHAQRIQVEHELTNVTLTSPIEGVITSLNVEEGETVVTGTMNNPGTVLMTIADLSLVEAEIEIDETDIVHVDLKQPADVRIDAFPGELFPAQVIEVGKSPIAPSLQSDSAQAVNFKVVVRLSSELPSARPGLSCTADITIARRAKVLAVPIQALLVRDLSSDANGNIIDPENRPQEYGVGDDGAGAPERVEEHEGVFVLQDGRAHFVPIEVGIAGERHFEVIVGVVEDAEIITGPFEVIRRLQEGDAVAAAAGSRRLSSPDGR